MMASYDAEDMAERPSKASARPEKAGIRTFKEWFRLDKEAWAEWREEAEESYAFVAGDQWDDDARATLKETNRPEVTFDRVSPVIRAVIGTEITNRQEVRYLPREQNDNAGVEVWTEAARWFRDQTNAGDEESDAFYDVVVGGIGWTETRLNFDENPAGEPVIERVDPFEMLCDGSAKQRNLRDRRRQWRVKRLPCSEAKEMFPGFDKWELHAGWADLSLKENGSPTDQDQARHYEDDDTNANFRDMGESDEHDVTIAHCMWREKKTVHQIRDPLTGEAAELDTKEYQQLNERSQMLGIGRIPSIKRKKTVYKQAFLGRVVLEESECLSDKGWPIQPMTGFRDEPKNTWYGLVRAMKDPQRWANKWLSQTMHILNSQAKGGVMAELDAVEDMREFEQSWARSDAVTEVKAGAISQGKIQPKPVAQFPAGFFSLMEYAISSVRDVTGVSLEMLGMRESDQPGVLEYQRRQQGVSMLASMFASLRAYRRKQGEIMLDLMQNYLADGRLVRIIGEGKQQLVPLARSQDMEYDIIIDEAPVSPNQKEMVWGMAQQNWQAYPPQVQAALAKYAPYPETVIQEIQKGYQAAMQPPPPDPRVQADVQKASVEAEETRANTQKIMAQVAEIAAKLQKAPAEMAKLAADTDKTRADAFATGAQTGNMIRQAEQQQAMPTQGM